MSGRKRDILRLQHTTMEEACLCVRQKERHFKITAHNNGGGMPVCQAEREIF